MTTEQPGSALREALKQLGLGIDLDAKTIREAVGEIIDGLANDVHLAAFLTGLRVKGETAEELSGAVQAVRSRMEPLQLEPRPSIDTCGTGGDGASTINISTATAIVVAAAGVSVAKHGNRSASGSSGSAEVLEQLGVAVAPELDLMNRCYEELGITFLFGPRFHPALKRPAGVRKQLPFRTIFNLIGPLANPARPTRQLIGVSSPKAASLVAGALAQSDLERSAIVTSTDGLDEVSLGGSTEVLWVESGVITPETWTPEDFGLPRVNPAELRINDPRESATRIRALLDGIHGPDRSVVLANSAASLLVAGKAETLIDGLRLATEAIDSGRAGALLQRWATLSRES